MVTGARSSMRSQATCARFSMTRLRRATPVGSTMRYSGSSMLEIVRTDVAKSCLPEQQMQFSTDSHTLRSEPERRRRASTSASPYSFSYMTASWPVLRMSSCMNVVLPAPRNPETTRTFMLPPIGSRIHSPLRPAGPDWPRATHRHPEEPPSRDGGPEQSCMRQTGCGAKRHAPPISARC